MICSSHDCIFEYQKFTHRSNVSMHPPIFIHSIYCIYLIYMVAWHKARLSDVDVVDRQIITIVVYTKYPIISCKKLLIKMPCVSDASH